jgi:hypothetical protein
MLNISHHLLIVLLITNSETNIFPTEDNNHCSVAGGAKSNEVIQQKVVEGAIYCKASLTS